MSKSFDIAIVGAGLAGLSLAALLSRCRHAAAMRIRVMDAAPRPQFSPSDDIALRVSAVANGSAELLQSIDAWSEIDESRLSPYDAMQVWDETDTPDSPSALSFAAAEFAVPQLGFIVENAVIQNALLQVLERTAVDLQFDKTIDTLPVADLVVGADGARSAVRELAGIATNAWPYEQSALVTHLNTEFEHGGRALQRFLRAGPLGMLPLADGRISVVWSAAPDTVRSALASSDEELGQQLSVASDHVLGELTVSGGRAAFPLAARHAEHYVRAGVALVGDAAHAIHPLAGQGANLGFQDVAALAKVIDDALSSGLYPADKPVLRRYERQRKGANLTMLHLMTGLNRLFATDSTLLGEMRLAGMRFFNRSGPIRERAVKVALGVN